MRGIQRRSLETPYFSVEAEVQRTGSDGVGHIICAVRVTSKEQSPPPGSRKIEWTALLKDRLIAAVDDGLVALDLAVREAER